MTRGDERIALLFSRHYDELVAFAALIHGDRAAAEDIVQDVFARILVKGPSWSLPANVRAYLYSAVRNRAIDVRRREASIRRTLATEPIEIAVPPQVFDADADREFAEYVRTLEAAWARLPERCRLIMHLRWRAGLPHRDIANIAGISVKGVEHQLRRGLRSLRRALGRSV